MIITGHLILVRHGEPGLKPGGERLSGWIDIPLSRKGIEEALECAKALENIEIDIAFASDLVRTQETLFIILSGQKKQGLLYTRKQKIKCPPRKSLTGIPTPRKARRRPYPGLYDSCSERALLRQTSGQKKAENGRKIRCRTGSKLALEL